MAKHLPIPFEGGCLCERLRYRGSAQPFVAYTCHCRACQKLTSSAFATCIQVPAESLSVVAGEPRAVERVADSGNRLSSFFCPRCGSTLYTQNHARPRIKTVYVGTLDDPRAVEVTAHIWTRRALPWLTLPPGHELFSEAGDWRRHYAADPTRLQR